MIRLGQGEIDWSQFRFAAMRKAGEVTPRTITIRVEAEELTEENAHLMYPHLRADQN